MKVLIFIEQRGGKLKPSALEALTAGAKLAGNAADTAAVVIGQGVEGLTAQLNGYGADTVFVADDSPFANYNVLNYAAALESAIKAFSPQVVVAAATPMGRDLLPRLAARLDAGMMTDVTELNSSGGVVTATKPMFAGKVLAQMSLQGGGLGFVSLRPNTFAANKTGQGKAAAQKLTVAVPSDSRLKTVEIRKGKSERADLSEAHVIVSGGRSLGSADAFKILQELADVTGATVGASRAAVDSGYAPHDMQVGQTGKTVNPNLYIAAGISGSIQHMAGMRTSKTIVAINTDPEAPIFTIADYGIVGDLFQAVPMLTKKFKDMGVGH